MPTCRMQILLYLSPCTNSTLDESMTSTQGHILNLKEEKVGNSLELIGTVKVFPNRILKAQVLITRIKKWEYSMSSGFVLMGILCVAMCVSLHIYFCAFSLYLSLLFVFFCSILVGFFSYNSLYACLFLRRNKKHVD